MSKPIINDRQMYVCTEPIFKIYIIKDLENYISNGVFSPIEDTYPNWLDYIEFYVNNYNELSVVINGETVTLEEGNVLVYNTQLELLQNVYSTEEEFLEKFWVKE